MRIPCTPGADTKPTGEPNIQTYCSIHYDSAFSVYRQDQIHIWYDCITANVVRQEITVRYSQWKAQKWQFIEMLTPRAYPGVLGESVERKSLTFQQDVFSEYLPF